MLKPYQVKIVEMMYKQETLMARLYEKFARKFPEHEAFWKGIAEEERRHARYIQKLFNAQKKDLVIFDEGKVKTYTLNTIIEHLENLLKQADEEDFSLVKAIGYTLDIERSLIEKEVFKHFKGANKDVTAAMEKLDRETRIHMSKMNQMRGLLPKEE